MGSDIMANRQKSLFNNMITQQLPQLLSDYSGTDLGDFRIDFEMFPFSSRDAIEKNGTLCATVRAACTVTRKATGESHCFNIDLLDVPVYTEAGFKIKNNYMQILDLYSRTTGWSFSSDYSDGVNDDKKQDFDKRTASLVAVGKSSIKFCYQKTGGIIVRVKNKAVPVKTFFRALSNVSGDELIEMFGIENPFIVDALLSSKSSTGRIADNHSRTECIDFVYNILRGDSKQSDVIKNTSVKQQAIQDVYFNQKYLNLGRNYSDRLQRSMSFLLNAEGKELAEDVVLEGSVLLPQGTILSSDKLVELDNRPINQIAVKSKGKIFYLRKFSSFTFRVLGYSLSEEYCGIQPGKKLTLSDLVILNQSELDTVKVLDGSGNTRIVRRRVRPRVLAMEDLYTVFNLYANLLNGYDVYDNPYELTNRVVTPFNKKIVEIIERNLIKYIGLLNRNLKKLSEDEFLYAKIAKTTFQLDEFIKEAANPEDSEAQMSDLNNGLHYISKCYKVTTDVRSSEATEKLRRVQDLQLGRTDSIDSPESNKIGLVHQRTLLAKETDEGYLTVPYLRVKDGIVMDKQPVYLSAQEEIGNYIAEWDEEFFQEDESGSRVLKPRIKARYNGSVVTIETKRVTLKEYTQIQNMSPARSTIPFMGNSNAKRLLMACNHQKQAVPVIKAQRPVVGTGCEAMLPLGNYRATSVLQDYYESTASIYPGIKEYKDVILNGSLSIDKDGIQEQEKTRHVKLIVNEAKQLAQNGKIQCDYTTTISIPFMQKTSEKSVFSFRIHPAKDGVYRGDAIIASDISFYPLADRKVNTVGDYGGLEMDKGSAEQSYGPGVNLVVGYKTYETSTIDDAICISSKLVYDETLTSITMVSKTVELRQRSDKTESFGLPREHDFKKYKLDYRGLAAVGAMLNPGDAYACVIVSSSDKVTVQYKFLDEYSCGQVVSSDIKTKDNKVYAEIIIAARSDIECGDKMSGRCGNKGVVSKIIPEEEMPYDPETGLTLDVILNPLGIPSRMNITQLLDCALALAMNRQNEYINIAPYYKGSIDYVREQTDRQGVKPMMLCDGRTGEFFKRPVNVGVHYMFKLVHMVKKKVNAISLEEPIDPIFQQPLKGQKNEGGQSFGEMESWCLQGIGATGVLQTTYSTESDDIDKKLELEERLCNGELDVDVIGENKNDLVMQTFTRCLGIDVDLRDGLYTLRPLSDTKIRSLNVYSVNDENDLHNPAIFGSDATPRDKMDGKEKWSYIDLHTEIVSPFWFNKGILNRLIAVRVVTCASDGSHKISAPTIAQSGLFYSLLRGETFVGKTISACGYPTIYKPGIPDMPLDVITGNEAVIYVFKNYDFNSTVSVYEAEIAKKKSSITPEEQASNKELLRMLKSYNSLKNNIDAGIVPSDYVISALPVMPQTFRPLMKGGAQSRTSDFDKSYKQILADVRSITQGVTEANTLALLQDIEQFLGFEKLAKRNISSDKDRTNLIRWFTGSGDESNSKHHGKIRENTLSKKMFCSGRSVIIPTGLPDMKPTEIGIPLSMLVKLYKQPLIGYLCEAFSMQKHGKFISKNVWRALFNAVGGRQPQKFMEVWDSKFASKAIDPYSETKENLKAREAYDLVRKLVIQYVEEEGVVELGRQPSLHQFSIRAYRVKAVDTKAIQIHPLVCGGYNADFDGDTVWVKAILSATAKKEALEKMSPASVFRNPKDSSLVLMPAQDIALGLYCATMLKNNVSDVYETPEVLGDIRYYSDTESLASDIDLGIAEYYTLVVISQNGNYYYATAGRILFNSLIPGGFTDRPFSNVLHLPIPCNAAFRDTHNLCDLEYDGIIAGKGGTRKDVVYCKLSKICEKFVTERPEDCIDIYQAITKFGFHASDLNSVTLSLDDINVSIIPDELQQRGQRKKDLLAEERDKGILSESEYFRLSKELNSNLEEALAGDINAASCNDLKHSLLADADRKKEQLENAYQLGIVHEEDRKKGIQNLYKGTLGKIKSALPASMDRNNNLFIIYDSGARGNIGQIMQTTGAIGILQKTKSENMEMPVTGNYAEGISSFDTYITSFSARTGVASTQNETQNAGHATRTAVYMLDGIDVVEDDCGKKNWWYDVQWGDFKNVVRLRPSDAFIERHLGGKRLDFSDRETFKEFSEITPDGEITDNVLQYLRQKGFSTLVLAGPDKERHYVDISIDSMKGAKVSEDDEDSLRALKNYLKGRKITNECLGIIVAEKLKRVQTNDGVYELYYSLNPVVESLLLGREASATELDGLPGLPYLEEVADCNDPSGKTITCITRKTLDYVEENRLERIPARLLLDCHSVGGVCAHCYGRRYTDGTIPKVGSNVGIEAAQSLGEPSAQLTMSLFHTGGAAGTSIAGGVEILSHLLSGSKPGGSNSETAPVAPHNGYVKLIKLDSKDIGFVIPEKQDCTMCAKCRTENAGCPIDSGLYGNAACKLQQKLDSTTIIVKDGQYVKHGESITDGYVMPNSIVRCQGYSDEEVLRKKQIVWMMAYFDTFRSNGIDINARHFEILARCQNLLVTIVDKGNTNLEVGKTYEFSELMRNYLPEDLASTQYYMATSDKYEVVTHFSGPMAMLTFENVAEQAAVFANSVYSSSTTSLIGSSFVGNNLILDEKKTLKQPVIVNRAFEDNPFFDSDEDFNQESEAIEVVHGLEDTSLDLGELDFTGLDTMLDDSNAFGTSATDEEPGAADNLDSDTQEPCLDTADAVDAAKDTIDDMGVVEDVDTFGGVDLIDSLFTDSDSADAPHDEDDVQLEDLSFF